MKRDYKLFINDITESIDLMGGYLKGISEEQFTKSLQIQDAVIRRLEIMGEATKNIPRSLKEKNKQVDWQKISNFRDFITHSYYEVSLNRIWKTCTEDIPKIKESLKNIQLV
jgi:uncharacterized protein with HEPN domain